MEATKVKEIKTQFAQSAGADFEDCTWTFQLDKNMRIVSGRFAIVDITVYDELLRALEMAVHEIKDWHEYNYNQIDSFDNNGTNNERDMQADIANGIYDKLQMIKAVIKKSKGEHE